MKRIWLATILLISHTAFSHQSLSSLEKENTKQPPEMAVTDLRTQMLSEAAYSLGFRHGMASKSSSLISLLEKRKSKLDDIFQFATLISKDSVLPPVITQAKNLLSVSPEQIRSAYTVFTIAKPERFVSNPPSWRDYLYTGLNDKVKKDILPNAAKPKNSAERDIWSSMLLSGWQAGEKQASAIIQENFNRLLREYTGMMRYSVLLQHGIISPTQTAHSERYITGNSNQIIIGDKLQRLTEKATFENKAEKWNPTLHIAEE